MWLLSYGVATVGTVLILPSGRNGSTGEHFASHTTGELIDVRIGWISPSLAGEIHQLRRSTGNDSENLARNNARIEGR